MAGTSKASAEAETPAKPSVWRRATSFGRLLVYGNPSTTDLILLCVGFISAIASGIPFPIMSIVFGQLVNGLNSATCEVNPSTAAAYQDGINSKILLIVYVGIAYFVLIYIYTFCWNLHGERLAQRLREKYFGAILRQDAAFFDKLPAGEVSSRIVGEISVVQQGTNEKVGIVINSVSFFVAAYVVAFTKDPKLAGMLVSLTPAYLIMALGGGYFVQKYAGRSLESMGKASSVALEALSNATVVHAFSANSRLEEKFTEVLAPALSAGVWKSVAVAAQAGLLYFIAFSANGLAFWQGSRQIAGAVESNTGGITVGTTFTVILILVDASLILSQAAPFLRSFDAASAAFAKLEADMSHVPTIDGTVEETGRVLPAVSGNVELRNVHYAFPSQREKPAVKNLSMACPAGQRTAIVGLSGSGKSTVAGLITRFYDADEGMVLLDGHDVKDLNVRSVRSHISLVQQEPCLLDRSILENIALGLINSPNHAHLRALLMGNVLAEVAAAMRDGQDLMSASQVHGDQMREIAELVLQAAAMADALGFIERLQEGLGTSVGTKGHLISGGQKQRISLARALIKDPRILILDEATASLDSASELRIQQALEKVAVGRTVITIAHRLSTVKNSDKIIVMRQGELIEQGTHQDLIDAAGAYAELVRLQNLNVNGGEEDNEQTEVASAGSGSMMEEIHEKSGAVATSAAGYQANIEGRGSADEQVKDQQSLQSTAHAMSAFFRPHLFVVTIAITGAVIIGGTYCGSAVIFGNVVGKLSYCEEPNSIRQAGQLFGLLFFILAIIEFTANFLSWSLFGWVAEHVIYKVRVLSLRSILEQELAWHESKDRTPSLLLGLITNDSSALGGLAGSVVCILLSILVSLIATITMTHIIAWKIAIVCLSVVPLLLGAGYMRITTLARFEERHLEAFANSHAITVEAVNSMKTIMSFSLEHEILGQYRRSLHEPMRQVTKQSAWANLWLAVGYGLSNFLYALAYWWGSTRIVAGEYTQTQFFIVQLALLVSSQLWGQAFALAPEVSRAFQATGRLVELLRMGSTKDLSAPLIPTGDVEATAGPSEKAVSSAGGVSVAFKQVVFSYPARPDSQVLHGLDLRIRPGQFAALVGPSGAGKSTIIALVERLYRPDSGTIEVDGQDIMYRDNSFRHEIAYVPQQSVLFDDTIRFNLTLGARPGQAVSQQELEEACKIANIHDTIMQLPDGYDSYCGPNGDRLSGGQKQRLAIARALVRKPKLLLLDESTSALDAESERLLQDGLEKATKHMTVIAIAHRLYTIRKADAIFLIENGQCVDQGTHAELIVSSESYRVNVLNQTIGH
ncbi:ABC transporter ATP-binding protein [Aspergillus clavatus NRRL 1]|uniref:ABC multidrug transporter, putative n=1 Tax=Aspergillus clavatus (strain ATCC 1007 / CBS 513.65 / DSM 816 / NCTC 3887 / NRRL 1 / QM 1276 / 107) TaxID=344612 RepID=A1C4M7_ASPCL|nr:ABC multidrug transporter, putative [Aspergillus clavatus NRRL 1]EAW15367.1 ABC multidrug transporter, putative [Aspergillus clavatus NRRL 1]